MELIELHPALILGLYVLGFGLALAELFIPGGILGIAAFIAIVWSITAAFSVWNPLPGIGMIVGVLVGVPMLVSYGAGRVAHKGSLSSEAGYTTGNPGLATLVGKEGVVHSTLHPTGTVTIDGNKVEATAAVGSIDAGTRVRVVEARRFEVVVEPVEI